MRRSPRYLLSQYVGGAESAIAGAFSEAAQVVALLLIDERDDFLFARQGAAKWERSMVIEKLRQMENLRALYCDKQPGQAARSRHARRFALQTAFRALDEVRAAASFARWFGHGLPHGERLLGQAPGDFALVPARARLLEENRPPVWWEIGF